MSRLRTKSAGLFISSLTLRLGWNVVPLPKERVRRNVYASTHEAGHGVASKKYGIPCHHVSIDAGRGTGIHAPRRVDVPSPMPFPGETRESVDRREAIEDVHVCLAGVAAELVILGSITPGFDSDLFDAWRALEPHYRNEEERVQALLHGWWETLQLVEPRDKFGRPIENRDNYGRLLPRPGWRGEIEELAAHLLKHGRLEGPSVLRILEKQEPVEAPNLMRAWHAAGMS